MRVRIILPWRFDGLPDAHLDVGDTFDVRAALAIYWLAMRVAQRADDGTVAAR